MRAARVSRVRRLLVAGMFAAFVAATPAAALHASAAEATALARGYWLVLASDRDGQTRPYSIRSDGSRLTPLVPRLGEDLQPMAVSRDGSTIVYSDSHEGPHEGIYVSRANGTGLRRVVREGWFAALSPNGKKMALTYSSPSRLEVIGTDGRGRRRLGSGTDESVDWSPTGRSVLLTVEAPRFPRKAIVVRPLRGRERVVVRGAWIGEAKWSPDGRWIAYSRLHGEDRANGIFVVRSNGTGRHRVAQGWAFPYSWSRDGRRLAFAVGSKPDVGIVGVDGRGSKRLHPRGLGPVIDALTWSPDGRGLILHTGQIWIVGMNGRGLRRVTKMVGGFDLVGWTRVAPAGPPAPPLLPSERVVAPNTVATGTPIADLSADGSRVAFVVKWTAADCDHVVVWSPETSVLDRFTRPGACPNRSGSRSGSRVYDVELAGSRAAWVSAGGCGNFCDINMRSATLGQRSPRVIATTIAESDTNFDFHLHGHGELLVFNDRSRLVRIGAGTQKCQEFPASPSTCTLLRRGDHAEPAESVSAARIAVREADAVAVVDDHGAVVRVFPFAADEVRAARLDGDRVVVAGRGVLEVYDVLTGMGVAQRPLPTGYALLDVDGGIAVLRHEGSLMLLSLDDGRSRTLRPGAGPVFADLEPQGLYYSYSTQDGSGRVVFVPRSQLFAA
jgi:dipeptidyl aminopeptidase/acylaminoacyl peptidase